MPRKKNMQTIAERIAAVESELEALAEKTKNKKLELKALKQEQEESNKAKVIEAFLASGKTVEDAVSLLTGE